jgi:hypothetical protein
MKINFLIIIILTIFLNSCSKVRESAGVTRKSMDEFQVIENPPLVMPPDFNLLPPDQLEEKNIENIEKELAKEILFGLDENNKSIQKEVSTISEILIKTNALEISNSIRKEIDLEFANEISTEDIEDLNWEDQESILDNSEENDETEKNKKKKKKRFFFF